ncbi:luciferase-like domain-containing protein [Phyllosticta citriasiana]|uniref:luciferase-like domain-containing protein n=1 Tax=Phyllosticta citriasiana TaxID=595635 RepID=UPI0030FD5F5F
MVAATSNGSYGANGTANGSAKPKKKMILNAFVEMCKSSFYNKKGHAPTRKPGSGHQSPGLWKHPDDESMNFNSVQHWIKLAQLLDEGGFHAMFIADVLGGYDVYRGPRNLEPAIASGAQWPVNEPVQVIPAMAAQTKNLGFGVTVATTYEQPYHLARRLSTLDHLTGGRVGWNVVTGYLDAAARNLGMTSQPDHDERYALAEEFMEVVYKLWQSSWREDAVVLDRKTGVYTEPSRVREINHEGKHFTVPGPHICQPSPQRVPVIMQAGTSKAGTAFSSKHAEMVFVSGHNPASCANFVKTIREQAKKYGRDPQSIKVLSKICIVLGRTQEEAEAKFAEYASYGDTEGALALFGGWTGYDMNQYDDDEELRVVETNAIRSYMEALGKHKPKVGKWTKKVLAENVTIGGLGGTIVGSPENVANELERWIEESDLDGFNIAYAILPQSFVDISELLIPELRRRGIFHEGPQGGTLREFISGKKGQKLPAADHPASNYLWKAPTTQEYASRPFSSVVGAASPMRSSKPFSSLASGLASGNQASSIASRSYANGASRGSAAPGASLHTYGAPASDGLHGTNRVQGADNGVNGVKPAAPTQPTKLTNGIVGKKSFNNVFDFGFDSLSLRID